jgi:hypothetical protein
MPRLPLLAENSSLRELGSARGLGKFKRWTVLAASLESILYRVIAGSDRLHPGDPRYLAFPEPSTQPQLRLWATSEGPV